MTLFLLFLLLGVVGEGTTNLIYVSSVNSKKEELTWKEIAAMDSIQKRKFYLSLTNNLPPVWSEINVHRTSGAIEDTIPSLPANEIIYLHYRQKVNGYRVVIEYKPSYDLDYGEAILCFSKKGHSFKVYCNCFSDEHLAANDYPYRRIRNTINLSKIKPGKHIYLDYTKPKKGEYFSSSSPFYFKNMDYDGEEELVINNIGLGTKNHNTYDVFKVFNVEKPLRLIGRPFTDDPYTKNGYKITDYNVEYEPKTQSIIDNRYDGAWSYGHYRYKSIPANGKDGLRRVFVMEDAEDIGYYRLNGVAASDSINTIQPYKKYKRVDGRLVLIERGVYESGNYGWNNNEIVLEKLSW